MKGIVFDFDGVLADSFYFHLDKIRIFSGFHLSENAYKNMHNGNFFESQPDELKHIDWVSYRDFVFEEYSNTKMREDVKSAIQELSKKYKLFVITSSGGVLVKNFLLNNNVLEYFSEIMGLEVARSKVEKFKILFEKHKLRNDEIFFVTDTLGDILEGNEVGVRVYAVNYGFHSDETLKKGNPYKIISDLKELL